MMDVADKITVTVIFLLLLMFCWANYAGRAVNEKAITQLSTHVETPHLSESDLPDMIAYDTRLDTIEKHQLGILAVLDLASRNDETLDKRDQEFLAIILIIQKELIEQRALIEKLSDTTPSYVEKD